MRLTSSETLTAIRDSSVILDLLVDDLRPVASRSKKARVWMPVAGVEVTLLSASARFMASHSCSLLLHTLAVVVVDVEVTFLSSRWLSKRFRIRLLGSFETDIVSGIHGATSSKIQFHLFQRPQLCDTNRETASFKVHLKTAQDKGEKATNETVKSTLRQNQSASVLFASKQVFTIFVLGSRIHKYRSWFS